MADAKYKPIVNIGNKDYLQVLAYMLRFDAKLGIYLYPEIDNGCYLRLRVNSGSTYENNVAARLDLAVVKYGVPIPQNAENYQQFSSMIEANEKKLKMDVADMCRGSHRD